MKYKNFIFFNEYKMSEKHYYETEFGSVIHSSSPSTAAAKAYRHGLRPTLKKAQRKQSHVIRIWRRNDKKEFKYLVHEVRDPVDIERDGIMIHYEYKTKVKSMNGKSRSRSRSKPRSRSRTSSRSRSSSPRHKSRSKR